MGAGDTVQPSTSWEAIAESRGERTGLLLGSSMKKELDGFGTYFGVKVSRTQ